MLGQQDCERLLALCRTELAQREPHSIMLACQRRNAPALLERLIEKASAGPASALDDDLPPPADESAWILLKAQLDANRMSLRAQLPDAARRIDEFYRNALAVPGADPVAVSRLGVPEPSTAAEALASRLVEAEAGLAEIYGVRRAWLRMLACHAAVRGYRWENGSLPTSLDALGLGELATDPFTGKPLTYQPEGSRYTLRSEGPAARPGDLRARDGRRPISVVPAEGTWD
jgi:hypothetical protein